MCVFVCVWVGRWVCGGLGVGECDCGWVGVCGGGCACACVRVSFFLR